jgi:hypothetical protein
VELQTVILAIGHWGERHIGRPVGVS